MSFLSDFNDTFMFSIDFRKILNTKFIKVRSLGAEVCRANGQKDEQTDRQTDMTKLMVVFHNFSNASNKINRGFNWKTTEILRELLVEGERK